ncbi:SGNH/GDSL hydrolase family protein [Coraliomargarita parva]|uniref:SGNH/GDSL hydrolase family protein n=1 Tax=Coraliomargarita parva TaxID=3014050 RepID=UPI0022B3D46D|nr:SGNH/GDSL hydrolase family protein [Coraliomargarita parva]
MLFENGSTHLFIGDSITDCGRNRDTNGVDLGFGYTSQIVPLIRAHYPELTIQFLNFGISGNRVTDLEARWDADVMAQKPDTVSIMIGINDVWRHFEFGSLMPDQVSIEDYEAKLEGLVKKTLPSVKTVIVMSPYYLETNLEDPMRKTMDEYGAKAKAVAERNGLIFVDVQAAFDDWLKHNHTQQLCSDRVHPKPTGHAVIAKAFLDAVGFEW